MFRLFVKRFLRTSTPNSIKYGARKHAITNSCSKLCSKDRIQNISKIHNTKRNLWKSFDRTFTSTNDTFKLLISASKEEGRIYVSTILNILENCTADLFQNDRDLILLQCCGHRLADQNPQERLEICNKVWKKMVELDIHFTVLHYNTYLKVAVENRSNINCVQFLGNMKCEPNEATYRLLLDCVCQVGEVNQANKIIELMKKKKISADEQLFNGLVLCHTINGGLQSTEEVLRTMHVARVPVTAATQICIIRGLAERNSEKEFINALTNFEGIINEQDLIQILHSLGLRDNHSWIQSMLKITGPKKLSQMDLFHLNLLCIYLIHMKKPEAAISYYKTFVQPTIAEEGYGFFLFEEMLRSQTPTKKIISFAEDFEKLELNSFVVRRITGIALRKRMYDVAWELLEVMPNLRPHYFWSLLVNAAKQNRESGVVNVLNKMLEWNVRPDMDTLEYYCIPFCDTSNPKKFIIRFQSLGFTIKELVTPTAAFLMKKQKITSALNLLTTFKSIPVSSERLLGPLTRIWSHDISSITNMLSIICKFANFDFNGQFLLRCLRTCVTQKNQSAFLDLVKEMHLKDLKISIPISEVLINQMKLPKHKCIENLEIQDVVATLISSSVIQTNNHFTHPRNMNVMDLENHLVELQNKNMQTRGVLKRLILEHCRLGNIKKMNEFQKQFIDAGYQESSGMKAALLQSYITNDNVINALAIYNQIKHTYPEFIIDDFKIIDLAVLLVKHNDFPTAFKVLSEHNNVRGGRSVIRNCWRLLSACVNEEQVEQLLQLLIDKGYCIPSNVILGPLIKIHLNENNLEKAAKVYIKCVEKYNCTPLQVELLISLVKNEKEELLQEIVNVTSAIKGCESTTASLIVALAQNGFHNALTKILSEFQVISYKEMRNHCQYWVYDNNIDALETLAKAIHKLPNTVVDHSLVYNSIMEIHSNNNDCESAFKFYEQLLSKEESIPQRLIDELLKLANRCKYTIPKSFAIKQG